MRKVYQSWFVLPQSIVICTMDISSAFEISLSLPSNYLYFDSDIAIFYKDMDFRPTTSRTNVVPSTIDVRVTTQQPPPNLQLTKILSTDVSQGTSSRKISPSSSKWREFPAEKQQTAVHSSLGEVGVCFLQHRRGLPISYDGNASNLSRNYPEKNELF